MAMPAIALPRRGDETEKGELEELFPPPTTPTIDVASADTTAGANVPAFTS